MKKILFLIIAFLFFSFNNVSAEEYSVIKNNEGITLNIVPTININSGVYFEIKLVKSYSNPPTIYFYLKGHNGLTQRYISCLCDSSCIVRRENNVPVYRIYVNDNALNKIINECQYITINNGRKLLNERNIGELKIFIVKEVYTKYFEYNNNVITDLINEKNRIENENKRLIKKIDELTNKNIELEKKNEDYFNRLKKIYNKYNNSVTGNTDSNEYEDLTYNTNNNDYEGLTYNSDKKVWVGKKYSRVKDAEKVYNTGTKYKYKYKYWRNGRWNYRY